MIYSRDESSETFLKTGEVAHSWKTVTDCRWWVAVVLLLVLEMLVISCIILVFCLFTLQACRNITTQNLPFILFMSRSNRNSVTELLSISEGMVVTFILHSVQEGPG